jgi:hypothetical protein
MIVPPVVILFVPIERGEPAIIFVAAVNVRLAAVVVIPVGSTENEAPAEFTLNTIPDPTVLRVDNSALLVPFTKKRPFVPVLCILISIRREAEL